MHGVFALIISILSVQVTISLREGFPPWITSEFDPVYYVSIPPSESITVNCKATNGEIRYQWYRNNRILHTNERITINKSIGDINFHNLSKEDIGMYHCQAINEYGVSVSLYFNLTKADIGEFSDGKNETKTCEENHYCNLICQGRPYCEPKRDCKIEWKMGEGTNQGLKTSKSIMIDRFEQPDTNAKQSIAVFNRDFKALLGEIATLQCIFHENPILNITWYKNGSLISSNKKYKFYNRQLEIQIVTIDDEGEFNCVSEPNRTMFTLYLNVTSPPIFPGVRRRFPMKYVQYSNFEEIVLRCNAKSAPGESDPAVIKWMRNGNPINRGLSYRVLEENRSLHIPNNNVNNGACYTYVAKNSEGYAVANFLLNITREKSSKDKHRIIGLPVVISAITFPLLLVIGGIILKRILSKHSDTKSEHKQIEESNNRHANIEDHENADVDSRVSDRVYHMPDNVDSHLNYYSHVSPANDYHIDYPTDGTSVLSSAANNKHYVSPSNEYNILGECIPISTDSKKNNTYDCMENVVGIYNTGDQRFNVNTKRSFECDYN